MKEKNKKQASEYLFSEIGQIDDYYISEADIYVKYKTVFKPKRTANFRKIAIAAVIAFLILAVPIMNALRFFDKDQSIVPTYMSEAIGKVSKSNKDLITDPHNINLFDRKVKIIWKIKDSNKYYCVSISEMKAEKLLKDTMNLSKNSTKITSKKEYNELVWINDGYGHVITPYLEFTDGNIGYGTLFDYNPEYEPSVYYTQYVYNLINESITET